MSPRPNNSNQVSYGEGLAPLTAATADPDSIMRIRNLELRAKVIVEGFMAGLHRSPYHGFSVEFTDYRQYSPGDDLRYLDWKLLARADRSYIKRFEDETNLRCHLLVDFSKSMAFAGSGFPKSEYAKTVAATLAQYLTMQRDAVGMVAFGEQILDVVPPRFRTGHLRKLLVTLDRATTGSSTDVDTPIREIAKTVARRGLVILISDLLTSAEEFGKSLRYLKSRGHDIIVLRILAPQEINFEFSEATLFHDLESGKEIYIDPVNAAREYKNNFEKHESEIITHCEQLGVDFLRIATDEPFSSAIFKLVQNRGRASKNVQRAPGASMSQPGATS